MHYLNLYALSALKCAHVLHYNNLVLQCSYLTLIHLNHSSLVKNVSENEAHKNKVFILVYKYSSQDKRVCVVYDKQKCNNNNLNTNTVYLKWCKT